MTVNAFVPSAASAPPPANSRYVAAITVIVNERPQHLRRPPGVSHSAFESAMNSSFTRARRLTNANAEGQPVAPLTSNRRIGELKTMALGQSNSSFSDDLHEH